MYVYSGTTLRVFSLGNGEVTVRGRGLRMKSAPRHTLGTFEGHLITVQYITKGCEIRPICCLEKDLYLQTG